LEIRASTRRLLLFSPALNFTMPALINRPHFWKRIFWCGLFGVIVWLFVQAASMYPVLDGDSISFLPSALTFRQSGMLVNAIYSDAKIWDPAGIGRLVHHGFMFQIVLGSVIPESTYASVRLALAALLSAGLLLSARLFRRALCPSNGAFGPWDVCLAGMAIMTVASVAGGFDGRPELLVMLTAVLAAELILLTKHQRSEWIIGPAMGLIAATSPVPAMLFISFFGIHVARHHIAKESVKIMGLTLGIAAVVFMLLFLLYPYPPQDWLMGMVTHSHQLMARKSHGNFARWWFLSPDCPLIGLVFLCGVFYVLLNWRQWYGQVRSKTCFWLAILSVGAVLWAFVLKSGERYYNLTPLTPLALGLLLRGFKALPQLKERRPWAATGLQMLIVLSLLGGTVGFLRPMILFPGFLKHAVPYQEARSQLNRLRSKEQGRIGITSGFFSLTEDYSRIEVLGAEKSPRWIMLQQVNTRSSTPPELPGYRLVENRFSLVQPRILGVRLASSPRGYNYAVYERVE
jgi:hypothetical protein